MAATIAAFLHYYPQVTLADLRTMPAEDYLFLLLGMIDNVNPEATEPLEDRIARKTREAAAAAHSNAKKRGGW